MQILKNALCCMVFTLLLPHGLAAQVQPTAKSSAGVIVGATDTTNKPTSETGSPNATQPLVNTNYGTLNIFPDPAQQEITVDLQWPESQAFTIVLTDMRGEVQTRITVPSCTHYHEQFALDGLLPGNYYLTFIGARERISRMITVRN